MQKTVLSAAFQRWLRTALAALGALTGLAGCSVGHLPQLEPGYYQVVQTNDPALNPAVSAAPHHRFYVEQPTADSLLLHSPTAETPGQALRYALRPGRHIVLLHREFDFDILVLCQISWRGACPPKYGLLTRLSIGGSKAQKGAFLVQ